MAVRAGDRAQRSGDFKCEKCQAKVHVFEGARVPKCPNCGNETFGEREEL